MLTTLPDRPNEYHDFMNTNSGGYASVNVFPNVPDTIWVTHGDGRPHPLTDAEALELIEMLRARRRMLRERGDVETR